MYTDNHIHDIVVKRNTSSSRKRSRDGMRSHITPAKKRSSFTSATCPADEEQTYTEDMTENKDTELFTNLSASEQRMAAAVGVPESFVARKAAGQSVRKSVDTVVVNRLYLALVLYSLLKETNLWSVSDKFQLTRGFVQTLLSSASAFGSSVLHFAEELEEFWAYKALLSELTRRLTYCVQAELIPLMEVAGVMEHRAKQLYNAGYKTLAHLANADPKVLVQTIENLFKKQANQIIASAKMLIKEKAEALQEEVDDLLMLPSDLPSL